MSIGGGNPQMEEMNQQMEQLQQHLEALNEEIARLEEEKIDIDEAIEAVGELDSGSTVQVPIGGGAYVRAEIADIDEIIVDIGADYAAERDQDGAVETLEAKKNTLDDRIGEYRSEIAEVESEHERLEQQVNQMRAQQMRQLQQGQEDE